MDIYYHIIANFNAGSGKGKRIGFEVEKIMNKRNIPFVFHQTKYPDHGFEIAQDLGQTLSDIANRIIVIGGDGTLHEVVSGLHAAESTLPIGYLPAGTGNDFARSVGLTKDVKKGLLAILEAKSPVEIECMKYHDHLHNKVGIGLNSMGFGLDAEVNALAGENKSTAHVPTPFNLENSSYLTKIVDAFKERSTYSVDVTVDGVSNTYDAVLITGVMKHPYFGGGIKIDPLSRMNNNELAVMIIFNLSFLTLLRIFPLVLTTGGHIKTKYFKRISGKEISIRLHESALGQVDGEVMPKAAYQMDYTLTSYQLWR